MIRGEMEQSSIHRPLGSLLKNPIFTHGTVTFHFHIGKLSQTGCQPYEELTSSEDDVSRK